MHLQYKINKPNKLQFLSLSDYTFYLSKCSQLKICTKTHENFCAHQLKLNVFRRRTFDMILYWFRILALYIRNQQLGYAKTCFQYHSETNPNRLINVWSSKYPKFQLFIINLRFHYLHALTHSVSISAIFFTHFPPLLFRNNVTHANEIVSQLNDSTMFQEPSPAKFSRMKWNLTTNKWNVYQMIITNSVKT